MNRRLSILAVLALTTSACASKLGTPETVENPKITFSHSPHVEARLSSPPKNAERPPIQV